MNLPIVHLDESGVGSRFPNPKTLRINTPKDDTPFPVFCKPTVIGCFSLDSNRQYIEGPGFLKFLKLPDQIDQVNFDLDSLNRLESTSDSSDSEEMVKQTNELTHLINWIHQEEKIFTSRRPDFVFYRGLMTKLLGTPYETREEWKLGAMLKNGTIYLRNIETHGSIERRLNQSQDARQKQMASWGYNFERFLLSDDPLSLPNPKELNRNECNLIFQTKLGSHHLVYAAEIDGVWLTPGSDMNPKNDPELLNKCNLVELKTTRAFPNDQMSRNFCKFNLRKWFCQSYTAGISHVIAGLRNDEGVVHKLKVYPTTKLSHLGQEWSSNVCFKFLEQFLTHVKEIEIYNIRRIKTILE